MTNRREPPSVDKNLRDLLDRSDQLIEQGRVDEAIALGPQVIRNNYMRLEGRELNIFANPTFAAKIHQRMIDFHLRGAKRATKLADKLDVRNYVREKVGGEFIPRILWAADRLTHEAYLQLPKRGVLKCNEGCGKNITISGGESFEVLGQLTDKWLAQEYYWFRREYQYYNMPRKLYVEEVIDDGHPDGPIDYIFYCFGGVVQLIQTGSRSHSIHSFFTRDWEQIRMTYREQYSAPRLPRPGSLERMIEVSENLSGSMDFVRIDLYEAGRRIFFGEMTLTPRAGGITFRPSCWNEKLGKMWDYNYDL